MIVVIADDLTGAAELGGIGLRYNLQVEITSQLNVSVLKETDLLIINTETRSMPMEAALEKLSQALSWIKLLPSSYIFKKVDSVLRGHVLAEINLQLGILDRKLALLLPANPRLGRTIQKGKYYIYDQIIHETNFAYDPEFPVKSSDVLHMIGAKNNVFVKKWNDSFPEEGIVIGELTTEDDMQNWMHVIPSGALIAGASSAFIAFLEHKVNKRAVDKTKSKGAFVGFRKPCLYISGSNYEKSVQRIKAWRLANEPVCYLPIEQPEDEQYEQVLHNWIDRVSAAITCHQKAIIAFDYDTVSAMKLSPGFLRHMMAKLVNILLNEVFVQELVLEGGATAGAVLAQRQIQQLKPLEELAPGVIRCGMAKDSKIWITLKPGSYNWYRL